MDAACKRNVPIDACGLAFKFLGVENIFFCVCTLYLRSQKIAYLTSGENNVALFPKRTKTLGNKLPQHSAPHRCPKAKHKGWNVCSRQRCCNLRSRLCLVVDVCSLRGVGQTCRDCMKWRVLLGGCLWTYVVRVYCPLVPGSGALRGALCEPRDPLQPCVAREHGAVLRRRNSVPNHQGNTMRQPCKHTVCIYAISFSHWRLTFWVLQKSGERRG